MRVAGTKNIPTNINPCSRPLFQIAYQRIWSSRLLRIIEIIIWTLFALELGNLIFDYFGVFHNWWVFRISYWTIIGTTPLTIVIFVFRLPSPVGRWDEGAVVTPVKVPIAILTQVLVVIASWIRFYLPVMIVFFAVQELLFHNPDEGTWQTLVRGCLYFLAWFPYNGTEYSGYQFLGYKTPDLLTIPFGQQVALVALAICKVGGYITMPITWSLMRDYRLSMAKYLMTSYFLYLLIAALLAWQITSHFRALWLSHATWNGLYPVGNWLWLCLLGLGPLLVSVILFPIACMVWTKRSR